MVGRDKGFMPQNSDYRNLIVYKKAVIISDITYYFCDTFLRNEPRLGLQQMIPAARSGKQNIVEGYNDGTTSREIELKLLNVGKGSLLELLEDYEDFLRERNLPIWADGSREKEQTREACRLHSDVEVVYGAYPKA